jgi:hypothetical protein
MGARGDLKHAEAELNKAVSEAVAKNKEINNAALDLRAEVLQAEAEEVKQATEEQSEKLKELREKKEKAAKTAESLIEITVNLARAGFGDEKAGEKAAEGFTKLVIGAAAEKMADVLYGKEIDKTADELKTSTLHLKGLIKEASQLRIESAQGRIDKAKADLATAQLAITAAVGQRQNALTKLGNEMADTGTGATDPAERKRIGGLIKALPTVELVASRATQLRILCLKAQNLQYTTASGIGFGILSAQDMGRSPFPDRFIRNASILVGITQEAAEWERSWSERAQSIQSMIDQIGQGPGIPGAPNAP